MKVSDIAERLNINEEQGKQVKGLISGKINPESFDKVSAWTDQCYYKPSAIELILEACNEVIGGFGVEYIGHIEDNELAFDSLCGLSYVNLGDTYKTTIIYNHAKDRFVINCWGSFVEKSNKYL